MANIESLILPVFNHLLAGEPWAAERLRGYAGAQVRIQAGPADLFLRIEAAGSFVAGDKTEPVAVTVALPADSFARLLVDRASLFAAAKLSGSADLAEALAFVFRNLRWDAEGDLSRLVGDIPARRLAMAGRHLMQQGMEAGQRLAENVAEYVREDSGMLVNQAEIGSLSAEVNRLRDDLARLEKRVAALG